MNQQNENLDKEEAHQEASGFMSYEELLEARKITFSDIKEHITGPVISTIIHVILLAFLGTIVVFEAPKKSKEIMVEMKNIEPQEIEPPPPPPEPPEPVDTNMETETPIETPTVEIDLNIQVDNISVDNPTEIEMPNLLNMKLTNSALKLAVPVGGGGRKGGKIGSGFGYGKKGVGDLEGIMYDLKTTPSGSRRKEIDSLSYSEKVNRYAVEAKKYIDAGLQYSPELGFKRVKKKLYISHCYIPYISAIEGPKQFGVEKEVGASGFIIHYKGEISPRKAGTYRFAGHGDDLLVVLVDGKVVFDSTDGGPITGWREKEAPGSWVCFTGSRMQFGDWMNMHPGKKYKLDIIFGERGGKIGAILLMQNKAGKYKKTNDGRPILPIFTTAELSKEEKTRIESEPWKIATNGPIMGSARRKVKVKKEKEVTGLEIK